MHPETDYIAVARIQTTHGRRGEVAAELLTDFPERFRPGSVLVVGSGALGRRYCVEHAWFHKGRLIVKFQGLDTLSEAATLAGSLLQVPRSERYALPPGRLFISDLMGSAVLEKDTLLGRVVGWEETGGVPLLRVQGTGGEALIPYTPEICYSVDADKKEIRVRTPEGLTELNRDSARLRRGTLARKARIRASKKSR